MPLELQLKDVPLNRCRQPVVGLPVGGLSPDAAETILANVNATNVACTWDDAHHYSPAPRHRRRLILREIRGLDFKDCLDAGCAQPFQIRRIVEQFNVRGYGCDLSDQVMAAAAAEHPDIRFMALDLAKTRWPGDRKFDLVVCSEVLEHIADWKAALSNLISMSRRHLLITVPSGKVRMMDRMVGHHRHFQGPELSSALTEGGCRIVRMFKWGSPVHSLYKRLISRGSPDKLYNRFAAGHYGTMEKLISNALYAAFYLNVFNAGDQLFCLARVSEGKKENRCE